jgi:hypothetical protein
MFFIARVTSGCGCGGEETLWDVSATLQSSSTGQLGAIITTIVASIAWQLVASASLSLSLVQPFTYIFLRICLLLRLLYLLWGLGSGLIHKDKWVPCDEVYIELPRSAANNHAKAEQIGLGSDAYANSSLA